MIDDVVIGGDGDVEMMAVSVFLEGVFWVKDIYPKNSRNLLQILSGQKGAPTDGPLSFTTKQNGQWTRFGTSPP